MDGEAMKDHFTDATKGSAPVSETGETQSDMRTARVTLEITHDGTWGHPSSWPWFNSSFLAWVRSRRGELVRVVEESAPPASVVPSAIAMMIDIITSNSVCVDQDEKHAAMATLVEAVCPGYVLAPAAPVAAVLAEIADAFGCQPDDDADLVEAAKLLVKERDTAIAKAASGAAGSYWMVRWPEGGDHDIDDELFPDEQTARDMAELEDGAVVVELVERHSASGAAVDPVLREARLRLTSEERGAITWASAGLLHDADKTWPAFRERSKHSREAAETLKGLLERHKND